MDCPFWFEVAQSRYCLLSLCHSLSQSPYFVNPCTRVLLLNLLRRNSFKRYPRSAGEQVANLLRQKTGSGRNVTPAPRGSRLQTCSGRKLAQAETLPPLRGGAGCKPAPAESQLRYGW
jgi:hypothetical protein